MAKAESKTNAGFIFLHRSIREHWLWVDPIKLKWWVDILMECNHADKKVLLGYNLVQCSRGQSLNSLLTWSKRWRVGISTVRRFMKTLESDSMIVTKNVQKTTCLTVCNYDSYNSMWAGKRHDDDMPRGRQEAGKRQQTKNDIITKEEERTPEQKKDFEKFEHWILENAIKVSKMKEPFTINQFLEIKKRAAAAKISELLKAMHNWEPLLKKNTSAYLTLGRWLDREEKENTEKKNGHEQEQGLNRKSLVKLN